MLAGALFNRAADIFLKLVELQTCGIEILSDNPLMRECGRCLLEAMELGKNVLHRSGEEGIDELWGGSPSAPFRFRWKTSTKAVTSRSARPCATLTGSLQP